MSVSECHECLGDHRGQKRLVDLELKVVVSFLKYILGTNAVPLGEQKVNLTT